MDAIGIEEELGGETEAIGIEEELGGAAHKAAGDKGAGDKGADELVMSWEQGK